VREHVFHLLGGIPAAISRLGRDCGARIVIFSFLWAFKRDWKQASTFSNRARTPLHGATHGFACAAYTYVLGAFIIRIPLL